METLPVNGHFLSMYVPAEPVLCQQCQECLINSLESQHPARAHLA